MHQKRVVLFDLDGTLTDTSPGIMKAHRYTLEHLGITGVSDDTLRSFIGPPLAQTFAEHFGFSPERTWDAVEKYREYYAVDGIYDNEIYDGMTLLLKRLRGEGKTLLVATSKSELYAEKIVEALGLAPYFAFVAGSEMDGSRARKSEVIQYALESAGIEDKGSAVIVGDTRFDIAGAREAGIDSIGVLYGFGSREELEAEGASCIAEDMAALTELLCGPENGQ